MKTYLLLATGDSDTSDVLSAELALLHPQDSELIVARTFADALQAASRLRPLAHAVIDAALAVDGAQLTSLIATTAAQDAGRVVVLMDPQRIGLIASALAAGATSVIAKQSPPGGMALLLRADLLGSHTVPSACLMKDRPGLDQHVLTASEHQLLALVSQGLRNQDIADQLGISTAAIKTRLYRLYASLGVKNRAAAVASHARLQATLPTSPTQISGG